VNCGDRIPDDVMVAPNPVIVVEVASPSTSRIDAIAKFADYMRLASVRHYILVDAVKRIVIHHAKQADGGILTAIQGAGPLLLASPGITLRVEDLFED
jgi:Uma2 family endonuclease